MVKTVIIVFLIDLCAGGDDKMNKCLRWGQVWWRSLFGETLSTALLIFTSVISGLAIDGPRTITHIALTTGFVNTALIQVFGPICGAHMNPAVTLAAALYNQINIVPAITYIIAQLLGSVVGFGIVLEIIPNHVFNEMKNETEALHGCTVPGKGVTELAALVTEAVLTGVLAIVICSIWAEREQTHRDFNAPVKIGLTIVSLMYVGVSIKIESKLTHMPTLS